MRSDLCFRLSKSEHRLTKACTIFGPKELICSGGRSPTQQRLAKQRARRRRCNIHLCKSVIDHTNAVNNTMLYCYYGDKVDDLLTQSIIVSLGMKGDGFYKRTYYSTW